MGLGWILEYPKHCIRYNCFNNQRLSDTFSALHEFISFDLSWFFSLLYCAEELLQDIKTYVLGMARNIVYAISL